MKKIDEADQIVSAKWKIEFRDQLSVPEASD